MIGNIDINKIVILNKVFFGKNDLKYLLGYKSAKKIDLYAFSFQTLMHIKEVLIKLNVWFFNKR